jgi:hypothetical protein
MLNSYNREIENGLRNKEKKLRNKEKRLQNKKPNYKKKERKKNQPIENKMDEKGYISI